MAKQVWLLYPEGGKGGAYVVPKTKDLAEAIGEIGERREHGKGTKYIIEASTMSQAEMDALPEFDGF